MSILLLAWAFFASFAATLLVVGVVPKLVLARHRQRREHEGIAGAAGLAVQPDDIRLVPTGEEPWADPRAAGRLVQGFAREGFRSAGAFAIPESPGMRIQLFAHAGQRLTGVVYEHPLAGHWIDVVERRSDGSTTTWSSARPIGLDPRPGHPRFHAPGAPPAGLVARALRERGPAPVEEVHLAELEALFERTHAEETAWRKSRGRRDERRTSDGA